MEERPARPPPTVQVRGHPVRLQVRGGARYWHIADLEQALGQPPGTYAAWLQTPAGQAACAELRRHLSKETPVDAHAHADQALKEIRDVLEVTRLPESRQFADEEAVEALQEIDRVLGDYFRLTTPPPEEP